MKTIIEQYFLVKKCLGEQKFDCNKKYRKMRYTHIIEYDEGVLFYNLITSELIHIKNIDLDNIDYNDETIKYLIENWFLVPEECDENLLYNQLLSFNILFEKKGFRTYTILPTSACNARCFYCFEKGHETFSMTANIAEEVAEFILNNYSMHKENVSLVWFGGEPLYNIDAINIITSKLNDNKVPFKSDIVTNGFLFNEQKILDAKNNWNLKTAQITLDGTEKNYNRIKNYIHDDCDSPYKVVLNNIKILLDNEIYVRIRLNMDVHNITDLYTLVDEIDNTFPNKKYLSVYSHLLFEDLEKNQIRSQERHELLSDEAFKFKEYIKNKGLAAIGKLPRKFFYNSCMASSDRSIVVGPDGRLAKCDNFYDMGGFGDVKNPDFSNVAELRKWRIPLNSDKQCKECWLYPRCFIPMACPGRAGRKCDEYEKKSKSNELRRIIIHEYDSYLEKIEGKTGD